MRKINDEISKPFVLMKVGNYGDEGLSEIMDRIMREIELERLSNSQPWYPYAYSLTPSDESVRYNLEEWRNQHGPLPKEIDLLFCADESGLKDWERFKKRVYSPEELESDSELVRNKTESWKKMIPSVRGADTMPDHYFVCYDDESVGYYALIIEDLILIPKEQNIALDLTRCVTFPGGEQIPTQFQGLVCTEAPMPVSTTYKTAWVIGKANLINPYAVRLLPP